MQGRLSLSAGLMLFVSLFAVRAFAYPGDTSDVRFNALAAQLAEAAAATDLAEAKLAIDAYLLPESDTHATRSMLDALTAMAWLMVPLAAPASERMRVLLGFLYTPGPWNEYRPFSYDQDDPLGKNLTNKLLSTYLTTRRGNCVSMPVLLVILGRRLGLRVTLATAPFHLLAKFRDETGIWRNVEATAGGFKTEASYQRELEISALALETGLYLRPLSTRESVAVLLSTAMEWRRDDFARVVAIADLALALYPGYGDAMLHKATALAQWNDVLVHRRYADPREVPPALAADYLRRARQNLALFAQAEALGWREPSPALQARYLRGMEARKEAGR